MRLLHPLILSFALLAPAAALASAPSSRMLTVEPGVQRILDITGLVPVLPVLRGRDEAIQAARSTNGRGE